MSHMTVYVHIICSRTLGDISAGPGRFDANRFYTRLQPVGGSKCSNDTACTFFDFLHGSRTTDTRPPRYRTGFDEYGFTPAATAAVAPDVVFPIDAEAPVDTADVAVAPI